MATLRIFYQPKIHLRLLNWAFLSAVLGMLPAIVCADIIWSGDFETGDFMQYHGYSDPNWANFSQMPAYGNPVEENLAPGQSYGGGGDGSLLSLVTSPVRQGRHAAKFVIKNSVNGDPIEDCDISGNCDVRRTQLTVQQTIPIFYDGMPYLAERWISVSVFLPSDLDAIGGGWGPTVMGVKPVNEHGLSGSFSVTINNESWNLNHRWSPVQNPTPEDVPWQYQMFYTGNYDGSPYPRADGWPDGLRDYPDVEVSTSALQSLNKGGWTDWVIHYKSDARGAGSGGTGFMTVWKREDSGPWIKVLHILPKQTDRGGMTFDHGIWYDSPPSSGNNGGFGPKFGPYMSKDKVWNKPANFVMYLDNVKLGDESATFSDMSPDGSSPTNPGPTPNSPPESPEIQSVQ